MLKSGAMQKVFINECKSCVSSNHLFFKELVSFSKTKDELVMK